MKRRLVCSDIHGEGHRLREVLAKAHYNHKQDQLILLGDYMDRGTNSKRTILDVIDLVYFGAIALRGNHDEMAIRAPDDEGIMANWLRQGGNRTLEDFHGVVPTNILNFLVRLPFYHEEPDCILVHAGLKPNIPLVEQNPANLLWIRKEFQEGYRGKKVIFGHTPTFTLHGDKKNFGLWYGPDKIGIDTGAAWGGPLTLFEVDSGETWTA